MDQLITIIYNVLSVIATPALLLLGVFIVFNIIKAFIGDEQDTKAAVKNIKRAIVPWVIIFFILIF